MLNKLELPGTQKIFWFNSKIVSFTLITYSCAKDVQIHLFGKLGGEE
jgi:hypothetical protein